MEPQPRPPKLSRIRPWRERAPKQVAGFRCCFVCGCRGGIVATRELVLAGYRVPAQAHAYAHEGCLVKAKLEHLRRVTELVHDHR